MLSLRTKLASWFIYSAVPVVFPRLNPIMRRLLKSPLHRIVSWYVVLLYFDGRKSGRRYEVPITYHHRGDGTIEVLTARHGRWWHNLRNTPAVTLLLRGRMLNAQAEIIEEPGEVLRALQSRDRCRRMLMPVSMEETVAIRFHFRAHC